MALSKEEENELKGLVLIELEKMFTRVTKDFYGQENREKLYFLLDIESEMKQRMMEITPQNKS